MRNQQEIEQKLKEWETLVSIRNFKGKKVIPRTAIVVLRWVLEYDED